MALGWIAVDLDGTLAQYDDWIGVHHIGDPIPAMQARVRRWISEGRDVRIFTARVANGDPGGAASYIAAWCLKHLGTELPITNVKDYGMVELWDDRCVQVQTNTGERLDGKKEMW